MTAWTTSATLAAATSAINATGFIATDASTAGLAVRCDGVLAITQSSLAAARLTANAATASRTAQVYALLQQPSFAAQTDAVQVLAFLLAGQAASSSPNKSGAIGLIAQITEIATQALEEIYGYRPIPINRPDPDQIATLIGQIAAARASAGLAVLPHYTANRTSWSPL